MKAILEAIAKKHLDLNTLETRSSDSLDFKEQAVWSIQEALKQAFIAGQEAGEMLILTYQGDDYWCRKMYTDQYGKNYVDTDGSIHTVTAIDGEPIAPITGKQYFIED